MLVVQTRTPRLERCGLRAHVARLLGAGGAASVGSSTALPNSSSGSKDTGVGVDDIEKYVFGESVVGDDSRTQKKKK